MSTDMHMLTGAYALDAIELDERDAFDRHLTDCAACTEEVRELQATSARLGTAAYVTPPPALRERVLAEVARTPQLPPLLADGTRRGTRGGSPATGDRSGRSGLLAAAAGLLVIALSLGGVAVYERNQLGDQRRTTAALSAVLAAPDARTVRAEGKGGGSATLVVSPSQDRAAFVAGGLPAPAGSRTYQLWSIRGKQARSLGLLHRQPDGSADPVLIDGVRANGKVGVTIEPAGGSPAPTTTPVLLLQLPS